MASLPSRRALALDFGRVLTLDPDRSAFGPALDRARLDPAAFTRAYLAHRHEYDRGTLHAADYWGGVLREARPGIPDPEVSVFLPLLIEADFFSWAQPRTALHHIVETALDDGVPMAIVSNMPAGVGDRFVASWPWLAKVQHRFFSADFGKVKPDEEFYRHVLEKTGWDPERVLFVDDLEANVEAAAKMGFQVLLFSGSPDDLQRIAAWCQP